MLAALWFSFNVTLIQISGAYFRYLPFRAEMTAGEIEKFWRRILIWSVASFAIIAAIFLQFGLNVWLYKIIFIFGWLPYALISIVMIRAKISLHIFVIGIQALWSIMIHTVVAMGVKFFQIEVPLEWMFFQGVWYISAVLLLIRLEIEIFSNLLWFSRELFNSPLSKYITVMPVAIFIGCVLPIAGVENYVTLKEQILRFLIPLFFFLMYRAVRISNKQLEELQQNSAVSKILNHQLETLKLYDSLIRENQKQVDSYRLYLRRNYGKISEMLDGGKKNDALNFIKEQIKTLREMHNNFFTSIPLLNAVFLIYKRKAEEFKIKVTQKIFLPENLFVEEMDFAVLLADLLGQNFDKLKSAPENLRELFISIQGLENQIALEIFVPLENSPVQDMTVAKNFAEKYSANIKTSQTDDGFKIFISWQEKSALHFAK